MAESSRQTLGESSSSSIRRNTVSNAKFEVEKFDGTNNFGMWQCEVLDVLTQQELEITLEDKPVNLDEKEWTKMNRLACGTIRLCLAKDQKYFVMRETSAKELWQKLENQFMTKSPENRLFLKKKLFRFQYRYGTSMMEHLNAYNKILADLRNLDEQIKDEDTALILLNSLPESYDHLTTTLLYGKDKIKFEDVSNALMNSEFRKKDHDIQRDSASQALTTRGRSSDRKSRGRLGKDECAYCKMKGHWKKDCPELKKSESKDSKDKALAAHTDDDDDDDADSAFSATPF